MFLELLKQLFSASPQGANPTFATPYPIGDHPYLVMLICVAVATILGAIMALVYYNTQRNEAVSTNFAMTLVMTPVILGIIISIVRDNVAAAFSMAGIFTLVRFRSTQSDPKDIASIVFTVGVGLAMGMRMLLYAATVAAIFCVFMIFTYFLKSIQGNRRTRCQLRITVPEDMTWQDTFDEVLDKYVKRKSLARIKTIELGSFFELYYDITLKPDVNEKEMFDEIRIRNGNLTIQLLTRGDAVYMTQF